MQASHEESSRDREIELLFDLIRHRYGSRLDDAQLADLRKTLEGVVDTARALRAVRLRNTDEPAQPFIPLRTDE